jgi:hypothetical protein
VRFARPVHRLTGLDRRYEAWFFGLNHGNNGRLLNDRFSHFTMANLAPAVLFDDAHGQDRWQDTGFNSREAHTKFSGLAQTLSGMGATWKIANRCSITEALGQSILLVIPPPTGFFDEKRKRWCRQAAGLFHPDEISAILRFIQQGGRLLLFAYRFGDSFTQTNLCHLTGPLGCLVNDDAVIHLGQIRKEHALQSQFSTPRESIVAPWALSQVQSVVWRAMATISILPGAAVHPVALSPGGRCIVFNRTLRQVSFQSLPIAVAGTYGRGRFAIFGGPHAFETGIFGLLSAADNVSFLQNVLHWLLLETPANIDAHSQSPLADDAQILTRAIDERCQEFCRVEGQGSGARLVGFVERLLAQNGILKALSRALWIP